MALKSPLYKVSRGRSHPGHSMAEAMKPQGIGNLMFAHRPELAWGGTKSWKPGFSGTEKWAGTEREPRRLRLARPEEERVLVKCGQQCVRWTVTHEDEEGEGGCRGTEPVWTKRHHVWSFLSSVACLLLFLFSQCLGSHAGRLYGFLTLLGHTVSQQIPWSSMYTATINEERGHKFVREQRGVFRKAGGGGQRGEVQL